MATGIAAATGDIICFLDSDDRWYPHKLETVRSVITKLPSTWSYLRHNLDVTVTTSVSLPKRLPGISEELEVERIWELDALQRRRNAPSSAICAPRRALEIVLASRSIDAFPISADAFLYTYLPLRGLCISLGASLGEYRRHSRNSYLGREDETAKRQALDVEMKLLHGLPKSARYGDSLLSLAHSIRKRHPEYLAELGPYSYRMRRIIGEMGPLASLPRRAAAAVRECRRTVFGSGQ
jgi:glycosyltransferase involved in cell wall biosynthesis